MQAANQQLFDSDFEYSNLESTDDPSTLSEAYQVLFTFQFFFTLKLLLRECWAKTARFKKNIQKSL